MELKKEKTEKFNFRLFYLRYKTYIHWGVVALVFILLYIKVKGFFSNPLAGLFKKKPKKPEQSGGAIDAPVKPENTTGSTISDHQARAYAEQLFEAMRYSGTEESVIYEILKGKSSADYNKIYNAFGLRYYTRLTGEGWQGLFGVKYSLTEWIIFELDTDEMAHLKKLNPLLPFK